MLIDAILLAFREITRNALRSFLTVLGIVIGVAAVIIMVTIGRGATAKVTAQIESLGTNMIVVVPGRRMGPGQVASPPQFDMSDAEAIRSQISSVQSVAPQSTANQTAVVGSNNWNVQVTGVTNDWFDVRNWDVTSGRSFYESEQRSGDSVCLVGQTLRRELFGSADPVGEKLRLTKLSCTIVGLLAEKGQSAFGSDQDNVVLLPMRTFQRRVSGSTDVAMLLVSVRDGASTETAQREITNLMRDIRRIGPGEDDNFSIRDMKEMANTLASTTRVMTMLLGAVAGVSLMVGGIGIMNIMLVSVTERTREIGTRLAIGALERDVLWQFLAEAVVLSSLGGLLGIAIALGVSAWAATLMQVPFVPGWDVIGLSFLFAAGVGVVFGFFPARRAAHMDPIVALRYE